MLFRSKRVADGLMTMLNNTGLLHGYSFNSWSDVVTYDNAFIEEWLKSPQTSLYYSLQVMGDTQDKSDAYAALDQQDVDDYLADLLNEKEMGNRGNNFKTISFRKNETNSFYNYLYKFRICLLVGNAICL